MTEKKIDDRKFLAWLTLILIAASLWIFRSYLHFLLVAAVLALATSHLFAGLTSLLGRKAKDSIIHRNREGLTALILTCFFVVMIFGPLVYFVSMSYDQIGNLDLAHVRQMLKEAIDEGVSLLESIPLLQEPLQRLRSEGMSFVSGPAMEVLVDTLKTLAAGVSGLLIQILWIMIFYFLFNVYGKKILGFIADLLPMSYEHEQYLYRECSGTVAVVFYGTVFNMIVQGFAFGILMIFVGDYDALYLGILAGFCSVIPIVGAALVYVPVVVIELLGGNYANAAIVLLFAWVVMGFFIDNILRMFFIGFLKKIFGFKYRMNEILILLAILAGIASFGFWGLIIGPSVLALTLAAANLYSSGLNE